MHVPISGAFNDATFFLASVKDVVEHGWFTHNPDLAAPLGQSNLDFAASFGDTGHYALIRVIAVFLHDPVVVFNAFYLLCFPLTAVTAYLVLRDLGSARMPALVMGVLFAFLPYHLLRHQNHLFLAAYYAVPLGVWLTVALAEGRTLIDRHDKRRTAITLLACVVVASASNYYAVFAVLALLLVVPVAALAQRSRQMAVQGALVLAAIGIVFALCHAPPVIYAAEHGRNDAIAERSPQESEDFGLKLTQMVLPRPDHRIAALARRGQAYEVRTRIAGEGFSPSLGNRRDVRADRRRRRAADDRAGRAGAVAAPPADLDRGGGRARVLPRRDDQRDLGADRLRADPAGARLEPDLAADRVRVAARGGARPDRAGRALARPRPAGLAARRARRGDRRVRRLRPDLQARRPRLRADRGGLAQRRRLRQGDGGPPARRHARPAAALRPLSGERAGQRDARLRPLQGLPALAPPALELRRDEGPPRRVAGRRDGARPAGARARRDDGRLRRRLHRSRRLRRRRRGGRGGAHEAHRRPDRPARRATTASPGTTCARSPRGWRRRRRRASATRCATR